jgi:hypothetical protein
MMPAATAAERREALRQARKANDLTHSTRAEFLAIQSRVEAAMAAAGDDSR